MNRLKAWLLRRLLSLDKDGDVAIVLHINHATYIQRGIGRLGASEPSASDIEEQAHRWVSVVPPSWSGDHVH